MAGISEALVATAVGLMVAIPAVIAFNAFNRVVKRRLANAEAVMKMVLSSYEHG
jgi:biopolymer transport protein ExbB